MWFSICYLFTDAEAGEDGGEEVGGGDGAGDGAEVVDGLADVLGDEVAADAGLQSVEDAAHWVGCVAKCLGVNYLTL